MPWRGTQTSMATVIAGGLLTLVGVAVVQAETMLKNLFSLTVETAQAVLHSLRPARLVEKRWPGRCPASD